MKSIAIIYFSAQGHTMQVAEAIAEGCRTVDHVSVELLRVVGDDITAGRWKNEAIQAKLNAADAIVFGCPTYMGGIAGQFKTFIDACGGIWYQQGWKNKLAAGFTHSQGLSGDKLNTLQGLFINAMQHGMIWVGTGMLAEGVTPDKMNRLSSYMGLMAQSNMDQPNIGNGDRQTAVVFGRRIAETVQD